MEVDYKAVLRHACTIWNPEEHYPGGAVSSTLVVLMMRAERGEEMPASPAITLSAAPEEEPDPYSEDSGGFSQDGQPINVPTIDAALDNARIMLLRLAKNSTRYTGDEIRAALQRWGMVGSPLREGERTPEEPEA